MKSELTGDTSFYNEQAQWELGESTRERCIRRLSEHPTDFRRQCTKRLEQMKRLVEMKQLEKLGDAEMDSQNYKAAADHFSSILSLEPADRMGILIKRSKARLRLNLWEEVLRDADEVCFAPSITGYR